jgi:hypothetical protein
MVNGSKFVVGDCPAGFGRRNVLRGYVSRKAASSLYKVEITADGSARRRAAAAESRLFLSQPE